MKIKRISVEKLGYFMAFFVNYSIKLAKNAWFIQGE